MSERDDATGDESSGMDFAAILRDEEFVESLLRGDYDDAASAGAAGGGPDSGEGSEADRALADLFGAMRHEVYGVPMPEMPTEDELAAALAGADSAGGGGAAPVSLDDRRKRRRRWMTTVTAGAASVAVLLGGIAVAGHYFGADAPARQSTQEVVTAAQVSSDLDLAENLLDKGDRDGSMAVIKSTRQRLSRLRDDPRFEQLDGRRVHLWSRLTGRPEAEAPEVGGAPGGEPAVGETTTSPTEAPSVTPPETTILQQPPVDTHPTHSGGATATQQPTTTEPAEPTGTTEPTEPAEPTEPTETGEPTGTVEPSDTAEPPDTSEPTPTADAGNGGSGDSASPGGAAEKASSEGGMPVDNGYSGGSGDSGPGTLSEISGGGD